MSVTTKGQSGSVPNAVWKTHEKQTTAAIVAFPSEQEATKGMSDDSEPSFRERVENIREERASEQQSDSSEKEHIEDDADQSFDERAEETADDAKQSFRDRVEEIKRERESGKREGVQEETPQNVQWGIVAAAFLVGGILGAASNPAEPVSGFFVIGFIAGGVAWAFATESGKAFRKEFKENMDEMQQQQQQSTSSSQSKVICSNCGWKNPETNNYCHDCGEQLRT